MPKLQKESTVGCRHRISGTVNANRTQPWGGVCVSEWSNSSGFPRRHSVLCSGHSRSFSESCCSPKGPVSSVTSPA